MVSQTPVLRLEPHNVVFDEPVEIQFSVSDPNIDLDTLGVFIQEDTAEHQLLHAWTVVKPSHVDPTNRSLSLRAKKFCLMFVAPIDRTITGQSQGNSKDVVQPGLTYRGVCHNSSCQYNKEEVNIPRGYKDGASLQQPW